MKPAILAVFLSAFLLAFVRADTIMNPSGIAIDGTATFSVSVNPPAFPDSLLVWRETPEGAVSFPRGRTGRQVVVRGERIGDVTLRLAIPEYAGPAPTLRARVVAPSVVDVYVYIVCSTNGHSAATVDEVASLFDDVNGIWQQACVSFQIAGFESVTNDLWLDIPKVNGSWPRAQALVNYAHLTGGLECYFVDRLGSANAMNFHGGLIVSSNGTFRTVSHEIGHACDLRDIYERNLETPLVVTGNASRTTLGTEWGSEEDEGYYESGTQQSILLKRLLMYGYGNSFKADIPFGDVSGLWFDKIWDPTNEVKIKEWHLSLAPIGFFEHGNPHPLHQ